MTTLFLYGLGCGCVLIITLLIWDSYAAKRRMREWTKDMKTPGTSASDDTVSSREVLSKRRKTFKPVFLMVTATFVIVAVAKWHSTTHESQKAALSWNSHTDEVGSISADSTSSFAGGETKDTRRFSAAVDGTCPTLLQAAIIGDDTARAEVFAWVAMDGLASNQEANYDSWDTINLNLGLSAVGGRSESPDGFPGSGINCDLGLTSETKRSYSLNGTLTLGSSRTKQFNSPVLMQ